MNMCSCAITPTSRRRLLSQHWRLLSLTRSIARFNRPVDYLHTLLPLSLQGILPCCSCIVVETLRIHLRLHDRVENHPMTRIGTSSICRWPKYTLAPQDAYLPPINLRRETRPTFRLWSELK